MAGQNLTTGEQKFPFFKQMLQGDALSAFEGAQLQEQNLTEEHFTYCVNKLKEHCIPEQALQEQKKWMRRQMRKPRDLPIRAYTGRVREINGYLPAFPPAFNDSQKMDDAELLETLEASIPSSWVKHMVMQGFDATTHTTSEFIEFCERIERTEEPPKSNNNGQAAKPQADSKSANSAGKFRAKNTNNKRGTKRENSGDKFCILHQYNKSHTTDQCKRLLDQANKMRCTERPGTTSFPNKNKTWRRDSPANNRNESNLKEELRDAFRDVLSAKRKRKREDPELDFEHLTLSSDDNTISSSSSDEDKKPRARGKPKTN